MREFLGNSLAETVKEYLSEKEEPYTGKYIGIVLDNNDPLKIGRVKARVFGIHDDLLVDDLPWAMVEFPMAFSVKGSFMVPEVNTLVYCEFDDQDLYEPHVISKVLDRNNLNFEADHTEDYPDSVILYECQDGSYQKINRAKGEFTLKSGSGCFFKLHQDGSINLTNNATETGDVNFKFRGKFTVDNRLADYYQISQGISVSAFSDISLISNGGLSVQVLDDISFQTNRDFDIETGGRTSIKSRSEVLVSTLETNIQTNSLEILPATSNFSTVDQNGIQGIVSPTFQVSIGNDSTKVLAMTVTPDPLGGPFNCILFDPLTGMPHQGRIVTGVINPVGFVADNAQVAAEIATIKAKITAKYTKRQSDLVLTMAKKYASIDSIAQLAVAATSLEASTIIAQQQASDLLAQQQALTAAMNIELKNVDTTYGDFLSKPLFGTTLDTTSSEGKRNIYNTVTLPAATVTAALDITNKTSAKDLSIGDGLFTE